MSDLEFERRLAAALRRAVPRDARATDRVMDRVRDASRSLPRRRTGLFVRGSRHSLVGLALAAGVGSITTLSTFVSPGGSTDTGARTRVIGDSVVATLRDTLRLVRLMFDDSAARQVAVVGDFNEWRAGATPLVRVGTSHRWTATLALRDGAHRYAFVVDGTRWVPDASAERVRADDGRVYSLLHVARTAN